MNTKIKLVTHNGSFHTDDVFAAATLSLLLEKQNQDFEIIRTRDEEIMKSADYVFDVGGVYDETGNRFDHHQPGGAGKGVDGLDYSSFGLVWKKFGSELTSSVKIAELINHNLVAPVDAMDNGITLVEKKYNVSPYLIQDIFFAMSPTWREGEEKTDEVFFKCVSMAKGILLREIVQAEDAELAESKVLEIYNKSEDKRIIVLDKHYPIGILSNFPEPMFVIYPRELTNDWGAKAIRDDLKSFKNRKNFPSSWAGLRGEELQKVSGVSDAIFCHRALFMVVAKSKDGSVKLAQIALES